MGWRDWEAYECDWEARVRAVPLASFTLTLFLAVVFMGTKIAHGSPIDAGDIRVIDGDTIRVHHKQPNVRLVGFNAPETRRASCDAERDLGDKATRRLRELVRAANLGTEGTHACNYGRRCGTLKADGRDVGEILNAERLAVPFKCGATRCPPTPKPWCIPTL
jgi:endonuclease YncB( thermonuclease family)